MKGLILFDWDNTLVDEHAHVTTSQLPFAIEAKVREGWSIGLNSDTPLKRLHGWWKSLGMNGPIIGEKGSVVWRPGEETRIVSSTKDAFSTFRQKTLQRLSTLDGIALFFGDSTLFITALDAISGQDSALVAMDAYRICSMGLFVRSIHEGQLSRDLSLAQHIRETLEPERPPDPLMSALELYEPQCFISCSARDADKSQGLRALLEGWTAPTDIIMVGDSMADYLDVPGVRHFAVVNAQEAFKGRAERVAHLSYTDGCIELLAGI